MNAAIRRRSARRIAEEAIRVLTAEPINLAETAALNALASLGKRRLDGRSRNFVRRVHVELTHRQRVWLWSLVLQHRDRISNKRLVSIAWVWRKEPVEAERARRLGADVFTRVRS